ncbi:DNA methylase N-4 [Thermoclostridium stercorarium subsp. leptospartum DSM 9219]|uniref:Methyltransferase n=1 Tax=Thermoclostridium stercorarium subsp. leptospartum DSM 9219 TaxID=1346611 RepID=A0A1B1YM72_THEST|nr:site-specific DNA-methyltransferase [Thermoclostridium stercorarium]ANX01826.1 DNA methylase N-4 [Thermoclostridium stercorarium subsp. leptospartum DSM 9219]
MNIQKISVEKLNPAAYNPRKDLKPGDKEYEKLKRSIEEFGYVEPVIWNQKTGNVVGGHQRLKVLLDLGQTEIDCVVVDLDPQREKALNLALNKIQGEWDENKLAELMAELDAGAFDVSLTGFDASEIDELLNRWYSKEAIQDSFDIDKAHEEIVQREPVTKRGDIWLLGNHRLMCGDSTKDEDFEKLMKGCHAQMAVTSPPYGVGKEYEKAGIEPWFETVRPVIRNLCRYADIVCWNLGDLYATGSQFIEPTSVYSVNMFLENGYRPIWIRIWKKQGQNFGVGPYHLVSNKPVQQYEYISAFSNKGEVEEYNDQEYVWLSAFAGHSYKFVKRLTKEERKKWGYAGIWEMTTVRANKEHPAMFPVELPWRCIKMHSDNGGIVLEPFSGSGTTIIAAEQTERKCYAMELSPVYCDLAVKRWEEFTGEKAVKLEG